MRVTVGRRLAAVGAVGVLAVGAVSVTALVGARRQADDAAAMARISAGMNDQWNADMMHDGIRGDVMAALYARNARERRALEVDGVTEKATQIVERFDAAAATAPPDLRARFAAVRPALVEYTTRAVDLVSLAAQDKAQAERGLPAFLALFSQLEERLGAIDEGMLAAVGDHQAGAARESASVQRITTVIGVLALLAFALVAWLVGRSMLRPLRRLLGAMLQVRDRDLSVRVPAGSGDEFAGIGDALNGALDEIGRTIGAAGRTTTSLAAECEGLTEVSVTLGRAAAEAAEQVGVVADVAQDVSSTVEAMTAATGRMDASIARIAAQSATAAEVADQAVRSAAETSRTVADLNRASEEIGEIVRSITSIAEQTNLLALNATIEAARAGEAGKGFAVVATEVKELAHETSRATDDITAKIAGIQGMTTRAAEAIDGISAVIGRINENQSLIAVAIEEQTAHTAEISRSVEAVATGGRRIADGVQGIVASSGATSSSAQTTQAAAASLSTVAAEVDEIVHRFRLPAADEGRPAVSS
ncbi:MAG TPA: methyl-accepting chemotaxis protein [Kineosporiaceae bacterium]|nr:methyl-accepting chemotaxis protein [Kineosporiaceae bacterium]